MLYVPVEPATIKMTEKYISMPHTQDMDNTTDGLILESSAISYQENQLANFDLWDSIFALISIFGVH